MTDVDLSWTWEADLAQVTEEVQAVEGKLAELRGADTLRRDDYLLLVDAEVLGIRLRADLTRRERMVRGADAWATVRGQG